MRHRLLLGLAIAVVVSHPACAPEEPASTSKGSAGSGAASGSGSNTAGAAGNTTAGSGGTAGAAGNPAAGAAGNPAAGAAGNTAAGSGGTAGAAGNPAAGAAGNTAAGSGGTAGAAGNGGAAGGAPGCVATSFMAQGFSDDFSASPLSSNWQTTFQGPGFIPSVSGGSLIITPAPGETWFGAARSGLVSKTVSGDFMVTATVHARWPGGASPGPQPVQVAGIVVQSTADASDWIFIGTGRHEAPGGMQVFNWETKTTVDGATNANIPNVDQPTRVDARLRICKVGCTFRVLAQPTAGDPWAPVPIDGNATGFVSRPDIASGPVRVGLTAFTYSTSNGFLGEFEDATFEAPDPSCQ